MKHTTQTIAINGLEQFFVITRFHDGSVSEEGPFATGEAAAAVIAEYEEGERQAMELLHQGDY